MGREIVTVTDYKIAGVIFGIFIGIAFFSAVKAYQQTLVIWKRKHKGSFSSLYLWLIWSNLISNVVSSAICWIYLNGDIPESWVYYFGVVILWMIETQTIPQIIVNRISLLSIDRRHMLKLKLGIFIIIAMINISVGCIWIPARVEVNETYVKINDVWDRTEKVLLCLIDFALNIYFIYIVRMRIISLGLDKYRPLFRFNCLIVWISLGMDVLIVGMMALKNTFVYVQVAPLAYIVKLRIEMSQADLLTKIAKSDRKAQQSTLDEGQSYSGSGWAMGSDYRGAASLPQESAGAEGFLDSKIEHRDSAMGERLPTGAGILKTVDVAMTKDKVVRRSRDSRVDSDKSIEREKDSDGSFC